MASKRTPTCFGVHRSPSQSPSSAPATHAALHGAPARACARRRRDGRPRRV